MASVNFEQVTKQFDDYVAVNNLNLEIGTITVPFGTGIFWLSALLIKTKYAESLGSNK